MRINILLFSALSLCMMSSFAVTKEERLQALENVALYIPSDDLTEVPDEKVPTPADVREKYNLTVSDLREDILDLAGRYSISETNAEKRMARDVAVGWIGKYGTTNELVYLSTIMTNSFDYAQRSAVAASINLLDSSPLLIPLIRGVVTNNVVYSYRIRQWVYSVLYGMCTRGRSDNYIDDPNLHSRIAAFFIECAASEQEFPLFIDRVACELNPSYRHSQQRRDNLARLRKTGLTGLPAQIYDAAQRDAQPKEDE